MRRTGGGWKAVGYTFSMARRVGWLNLWRAMRSKNACKTCALGMGGQAGGMRNEAGHFPEVCKKSLQAMVADMQGAIASRFFERYSIEHLQSLTPRELETAGRLVDPVILQPGQRHYRTIEWDEALRRIATRFRSAPPDRSFFYFSGRSSNEAGFLLQLLARLHGTNNVNNCSFYCHQASGVGLGRSIGTGTATVSLDDIDDCDLFVLIGGNPASNHPRLLRSLMSLRRRGGHVVVINPVREIGLVKFSVPSDVRSLLFGSSIASLYLQPNIGGDIALLTGLAKRLLERNAIDREFVEKHTDGLDELARRVEQATWEEIESRSGVARKEIAAFADVYQRSKRTIFGWTMGITHHQHGVENVQWIVNVALLRGMVGRRGAGLLPIRGHSNVQGIGSMGVSPALKEAVCQKLEERMGVKLPRSPGLDTMATIDAAARGELDVGLCLGGNLYGSNPDARHAQRALGQLDLVVYLSTSLNTGHARGLARTTIILPVLARDEDPQKTTQESMFNYVRLSDGGEPRHVGPRGEVAVIADLGQLIVGEKGLDWRSMRETSSIRQAIADVIPGYENVRDIDQTGQEFQIPGRIYHQPLFSTPSGNAKFASHPIPEPSQAPDELRLMTVRSEGQFNTVVYEEEDLYRGQERRDVVLMNEEDMARRGLVRDQPVLVRSQTGSLRLLARPFDIRQGNCMVYYPEANVLVPAVVDPASKTPAFKSIPVTVTAAPPVSRAHFVPLEVLEADSR